MGKKAVLGSAAPQGGLEKFKIIMGGKSPICAVGSLARLCDKR